MSMRMPTIFFGHGNPMNAIRTNEWTEAWAAIGTDIARPRAILSVSAHWYVPQRAVTAMQTPRTIHDFGGFPRQLFQYQYPAPGDPGLAKRTRELLAPLDVGLDESWGLDHGTWSVLCHVFPQADVPVVQLCIDETKPPGFHYEIGQRLRALRDEGILVIGSGDIVHNLHAYAWGMHSAEPYDWALRFESKARQLILAGDHQPLINYESLGKDALLSVPTPEHYLPLLYVLGASESGERVTFPVEGIDGGSVSMLAIQIGSVVPAMSLSSAADVESSVLNYLSAFVPRCSLDNERGFHRWMQCADVCELSGLAKRVLPTLVRCKLTGVDRAVFGRRRVRE